MDEKRRLREVESYHILDTPPDQELNEFTQIASLVCDVPFALITILDKNRQWFKSKIGLDISEIKSEDSFCQHLVHLPAEILVVNDSLLDARFQNSPFVKGEPNIRFYAGVPLETATGNILGTLCILDMKPRELTENQSQVLRLLGKKVMNFLDSRKTLLEQESRIENNASKLKKMTDNLPAGVFQLKREQNGNLHFDFLSKGMTRLHPGIDMQSWKSSPEIGFSVIHPEDLELFQASLLRSFNELTDWDLVYRVRASKGFHWHMVKARPERLPDQSVVWYGSFQDVTSY